MLTNREEEALTDEIMMSLKVEEDPDKQRRKKKSWLEDKWQNHDNRRPVRQDGAEHIWDINLTRGKPSSNHLTLLIWQH